MLTIHRIKVYWIIWYGEIMVLILDGNSEDVAHICRKTDVFSKINGRFATFVDLNKCLKHIKLPISLHMFAPFCVTI